MRVLRTKPDLAGRNVGSWGSGGKFNRPPTSELQHNVVKILKSLQAK